ncbi:MAG: serine hydroxymethyltransferase [Alphaproteobacteria bacterium RIFCSPLOWO2_01_FULL_40_26]|nr:MAG: serine hydroxymethyltransferase [Alphaproteobacteria bacterium RIFCSPHIGHO2_02_FULL_40_34]OFW88453.1 MAG: serine hydroxymethyltransferase [Alphaproteobacteria bacterium RIFCSPHIGHO2_01_FULL_40_8]OFW94829.1 MAG: serine hydroxymethyltransferase [Alphaproteobacteria bacterium RIFCSPLOWO2_01_FULL_40_26]OFX10455.1 MAG: serine hydroxymethyltransferase [Alphaproteobacteria bacterium RIFCSPLOWO2_02_FULL_40_19]OFX11029.1 MAG: serine hydroxymethyltransferase [Alphaproteobacteria bacterium RIFCSPL
MTFFSSELSKTDPTIFSSIQKELDRQKYQIELIASENIVSRAVLEAQGSVFTNKYAEGYPAKRYYGGCEFSDEIEQTAIDRLCQLFGAKFANVQPHSGASANLSVYLALLQPGDTILGMSLAAGGHLTHGAQRTISGMWFKSVQYGIRADDGLIDYEQAENLAREHKPKLIVAGISSYPRIVDWTRFKKIADEIGALLMVDMAHIAGLVAAGIYPSPIGIADIVTSTTHKTLRGPRGGVILTNNEELAKKINSAVFPGLQGGPLMHVIAAKAVAFGEALKPEFKIYAKQIVANAKILAEILVKRGLKITTNGTDCHLMVVDLTPLETLTGKEAEKVLERAGLTCNKNAIPNDPRSPFITSGLRFGTAAGTTRGFKEKEFEKIGHMICDCLEGFVKNGEENNRALEQKIKSEVVALCKQFPIY